MAPTLLTLRRAVRCSSSRPTRWCGWSTILAVATALLATHRADAQCTPQWLPGDGFDLRGGAATDVVNAVVAMPNGDLVIGGQFTSVAGVTASNIARWNGVAWSPLGSGIQGGEVRSLAVLLNGDVVAGGAFTLAGATPVNNIARWDGASWSALGSGVTGSTGMTTGVFALAVLPSGDLVVGGHFTTAGGVGANNVALWSGSWAPMGAGLTNPPAPPLFQWSNPLTVSALAVRPNGALVAGTDSAYAYPGGRVVQWNGATWTSLGTVSPLSPRVRCLASLANNDLLAGVDLAGLGYQANVMRLDAAGWTTLGFTESSPTATVRAITVLGNGDIVCGGHFQSMGGVATPNLARWDGVAWSSLGDVGGDVACLKTLANGVMVAAGSFGPTSTVDCDRLGRWGCDPAVAAQVPFGRGCYWRATSFYEHFTTAHTFDLSASTLRMSLTATGYDVVHVPGAPIFVQPPAGTELPLSDDSVTAPLPLPFALPYPGGSTTQVVVASNGHVFLQPSTLTSAYNSPAGLLQNEPRHAAMWTDFDPAFPGTGSGTIHFHVAGQTAYATWVSVQEYGYPSVVSTFQIAMSSNGTVEYRYQQCDHVFQALTGWSPGLGAQDPTGRDLTAGGSFSTTSTMFRLPLLHAADQRPKLGASVTLTTSQLDPASVLGINLIGFTKHDPGIELSGLGMPDCYLYTSLDLMFPFFPAAQSGSHTIGIPNQASLIGFQLYAQGVAWDFPANAFGMVSSNGLTLTLGGP